MIDLPSKKCELEKLAKLCVGQGDGSFFRIEIGARVCRAMVSDVDRATGIGVDTRAVDHVIEIGIDAPGIGIARGIERRGHRAPWSPCRHRGWASERVL